MDTPKRVRVLRVIEYDYASVEAMIADRVHWHIQGVHRQGNLIIHSSVVSTIMEDGTQIPFHFTQEGPGLT